MKAKLNLVKVLNDKEQRKAKDLSDNEMSQTRGGQPKAWCQLFCKISNDSIAELLYFL